MSRHLRGSWLQSVAVNEWRLYFAWVSLVKIGASALKFLRFLSLLDARIHIYTKNYKSRFNLAMAFVGVEFLPEDGGGVAIASFQWFTPRKQEVFWPPCKTHTRLEKLLRKGENPDATWNLYKVHRRFFETGNYSF